MENIFPLQEHVEIEEIYGSKRPNSRPPRHPKTHIFSREPQRPVEDVYTVRRPGWLTLEGISRMEEVSMEDVIDAIGEEKYMEARNKIVQAYEDGERPMRMARAIEMAGMDLSPLLRIFAFLEMWGIVNLKSLLEKESRGLAGEMAASPEDVKEDRKKLLDPKRVFQESRCGCGKEGRWFSSCGVVACADCHRCGDLPQSLSQSDFYEATDSLLRNLWSRNEELLLLEGILQFGDQWNLVSEHVGTKTKDQCVFHFLNMPILENTLSNLDFNVGMPFMTAENPVMCLIAFFCAIVHPSVAAEGARAAIKNVASPNVIDAVFDSARSKAVEQIRLEDEKIRRLEDVINEAFLAKLRLKMGKYKELHDSVEKIREELAGLRQALIEEHNAANSED
jgi:SWI/SNF related-matrix-associated actin-dependent regulator of chromatin subfamily C